MLEILKKKKEELLMEKSMNEAYQAYIYIMNRETNIHNIYAGKIITKPSTEEMMLNNLKKMCFLRGEKVEITNSIKSYIEDKIGKLDKYFENANDILANVVIKVRGKEQKIEITVPAMNYTLRSEESNDDLYAAIDLTVDKLERQIRKHKTKLNSKIKKNIIKNFDIDLEDDLEDENSKIIKRKKVDMKPMNEEEAILQMNMLGHSFFVFKNSSNNLICVLYLRKDGSYGIIEAN